MTLSFFPTMNSNNWEPLSLKMVWRRTILIRLSMNASAGKENNIWFIGLDTQRTMMSGYQGKCSKIMRHWTSGKETTIQHSELYLYNFFFFWCTPFHPFSFLCFDIFLLTITSSMLFPYSAFQGGEGCKPGPLPRLLTSIHLHLQPIHIPDHLFTYVQIHILLALCT